MPSKPLPSAPFLASFEYTEYVGTRPRQGLFKAKLDVTLHLLARGARMQRPRSKHGKIVGLSTNFARTIRVATGQTTSNPVTLAAVAKRTSRRKRV